MSASLDLPEPALVSILTHFDGDLAARWRLRAMCRRWRQLIDSTYYAGIVWRDCRALSIYLRVSV